MLMRHVEWLGEPQPKTEKKSTAPLLLWAGVVAGAVWIFFKTISPVR